MTAKFSGVTISFRDPTRNERVQLLAHAFTGDASSGPPFDITVWDGDRLVDFVSWPVTWNEAVALVERAKQNGSRILAGTDNIATTLTAFFAAGGTEQDMPRWGVSAAAITAAVAAEATARDSAISTAVANEATARNTAIATEAANMRFATIAESGGDYNYTSNALATTAVTAENMAAVEEFRLTNGTADKTWQFPSNTLLAALNYDLRIRIRKITGNKLTFSAGSGSSLASGLGVLGDGIDDEFIDLVYERATTTWKEA